jgi:hypothetical protein
LDVLVLLRRQRDLGLGLRDSCLRLGELGGGGEVVGLDRRELVAGGEQVGGGLLLIGFGADEFGPQIGDLLCRVRAGLRQRVLGVDFVSRGPHDRLLGVDDLLVVADLRVAGRSGRRCQVALRGGDVAGGVLLLLRRVLRGCTRSSGRLGLSLERVADAVEADDPSSASSAEPGKRAGDQPSRAGGLA